MQWQRLRHRAKRGNARHRVHELRADPVDGLHREHGCSRRHEQSRELAGRLRRRRPPSSPARARAPRSATRQPGPDRSGGRVRTHPLPTRTPPRRRRARSLPPDDGCSPVRATTPGRVVQPWRPHSSLSVPAHRPARGSSPGGDRLGARPAADRRVAPVVQRVLGQVAVGDVAVDVVVGPRCDRVDLHDPAADVEADDRARSARVDASSRRRPVSHACLPCERPRAAARPCASRSTSRGRSATGRRAGCSARRRAG